MNGMSLTHATGCSKPPPDSRLVKPGWLRLKCPECAHVGSVAYVAPDKKLPPEREPRPIGSGYRCRDHHDQPVTWRGKGCTKCTRAKRTATPRAELGAS